MKVAMYFCIILTVIALGVLYTASIWHECRQTNSFLYCVHILGGK